MLILVRIKLLVFHFIPSSSDFQCAFLFINHMLISISVLLYTKQMFS